MIPLLFSLCIHYRNLALFMRKAPNSQQSSKAQQPNLNYTDQSTRSRRPYSCRRSCTCSTRTTTTTATRRHRPCRRRRRTTRRTRSTRHGLPVPPGIRGSRSRRRKCLWDLRLVADEEILRGCGRAEVGVGDEARQVEVRAVRRRVGGVGGRDGEVGGLGEGVEDVAMRGRVCGRSGAGEGDEGGGGVCEGDLAGYG